MHDGVLPAPTKNKTDHDCDAVPECVAQERTDGVVDLTVHTCRRAQLAARRFRRAQTFTKCGGKTFMCHICRPARLLLSYRVRRAEGDKSRRTFLRLHLYCTWRDR